MKQGVLVVKLRAEKIVNEIGGWRGEAVMGVGRRGGRWVDCGGKKGRDGRRGMMVGGKREEGGDGCGEKKVVEIKIMMKRGRVS